MTSLTLDKSPLPANPAPQGGPPNCLAGLQLGSILLRGGRSRCVRFFALTRGSSMLAIILSLSPQRAQCSISMPITSFSGRAQLIATCRGGEGLPASLAATDGFGAPIPLRAGVDAACSRLCGANTP